MKKILIISQSSLGSSFKSKYSDIYSIDSYHNFDMKEKEDCIKLTEKIYDYDVLIITTGSHTGDLWDIVSVNFTGPCYIISELVKNNFKGQIIYIGSYGSVWTSWPGIPIERLIYNTSKLSSKKFIQGLEHSKISNTRLSILNPSKFKTKMSQFQGMEVNEIINIIKWIVDSSSDINITNIEFTGAK
jgi:short-subunit dehydrogenase